MHRLLAITILLLMIALAGCRGEQSTTSTRATAAPPKSTAPPVAAAATLVDGDWPTPDMRQRADPQLPEWMLLTMTPPPGPPPPTPDLSPASDAEIDQGSGHEVVASVPVGEYGVHYERGPEPWGPQAFAVAPDGAFWIVDTVGERLLRLTVPDEPLETVDLNGLVTLPYDLAIASDQMWVLGTGKLPGPVLLDMEGGLLATYSLRSASDAELLRGSPGEASAVLLRAGGPFELWWLIDPPDPGKGARYDFVRGTRHDSSRLPHKNDDGTSYIVVDDMDWMSPVFNIDQTVRHVAPDGEVLGVAQTHLKDLLMPVRNRLKVGPDGAVYELVTRDDVVEIVRLRFGPAEPQEDPDVEPTPP